MTSTVLAWRFSPAKVSVVVRDKKLGAALLKASGQPNLCVSGHETQVLIPVAELHEYRTLLGFTAAQITSLENARNDRLVEARS